MLALILAKEFSQFSGASSERHNGTLFADVAIRKYYLLVHERDSYEMSSGYSSGLSYAYFVSS